MGGPRHGTQGRRGAAAQRRGVRAPRQADRAAHLLAHRHEPDAGRPARADARAAGSFASRFCAALIFDRIFLRLLCF